MGYVLHRVPSICDLEILIEYVKPCVGITRLKRWQRADRLGLNPPLEVLAVLTREEKQGTAGIERAHIDDILNSAAVAAS